LETRDAIRPAEILHLCFNTCTQGVNAKVAATVPSGFRENIYACKEKETNP